MIVPGLCLMGVGAPALARRDDVLPRRAVLSGLNLDIGAVRIRLQEGNVRWSRLVFPEAPRIRVEGKREDKLAVRLSRDPAYGPVLKGYIEVAGLDGLSFDCAGALSVSPPFESEILKPLKAEHLDFSSRESELKLIFPADSAVGEPDVQGPDLIFDDGSFLRARLGILFPHVLGTPVEKICILLFRGLDPQPAEDPAAQPVEPVEFR